MNWDMSNWSMEYWNNLWTALGGIGAILTIVISARWVKFESKQSQDQFLLGRREEVIVFLRLIMNDFEKSIGRTYMYVPNMDPKIFLNKKVGYSVFNFFKTTRMTTISNLLIKENKEYDNYVEMDLKIDSAIMSEIMYIDKMILYINISFKDNDIKILMKEFLNNYKLVIRYYIFFWDCGNKDVILSDFLKEISDNPNIEASYPIGIFESAMEDLHNVFVEKEDILQKLNSELILMK